MEQKLQDRLPVCHIPHCNKKHIYVFPEKEVRGPQSQFPHSCVCKPFIYKYVDRSWEYIPRIGPHIFLQQNRQTDRGNTVQYINRSQTHECGNWNWGRAIPFLAIFVSNFRYCVFAVHLCSLVSVPGYNSVFAGCVSQLPVISGDGKLSHELGREMKTGASLTIALSLLPHPQTPSPHHFLSGPGPIHLPLHLAFLLCECTNCVHPARNSKNNFD